MRRPSGLIADDEPQLLRHLESLLASQWPDLQIAHRARNGLEAAELIATHEPDVAFLDIRMPGLSGLEVAQAIEGRTRVVFVTAFDEFAVRAFEHEALDYVLKPVNAARLERTVARVRRALEAPLAGAGSDAPADDAALARVLRQLLAASTGNTSPASGSPQATPLRWIRASQGDLTTQIAVDDALVFHADDKYTIVFTAQGEHLIRTPIIDLVPQLDPARFQQIHRSTLVNLAAVTSTRRDESSRLFVRLRGLDREWPVSRAYVHLFRPM